VHALLGHNGCGKSTLIKCLAGVQPPDPGGEVWIDDEALRLGDAEDAQRKGLRFVHQDLGIIPELGAVDNVGFVLGYERRGLAINWRRQAKRTTELLRQFGFDLDPLLPLAQASPPQRTAVAIVRAVAGWTRGRGVLILDEPTASLAAHEVDQLFALIRDVSSTGTAVILVSHRLDEVMAVADHATVLRDGIKVWSGPLSKTSLAGLVDLIANTGDGDGSPEDGAPSHPAAPPSAKTSASAAATVLEVSKLSGRYLRNIDLRVREGEVLGIAGLLGSGREELPYILAGDETDGVTGTFSIDGVTAEKLTVSKARQLGIALVPADRAREGIFAEFTTTENVSLAGMPGLSQGGVVAPPAERKFAAKWLAAVHADPDYGPRLISTLSGGNQQKAVLARWLSVSPRLLVLSEPTAGVDIGARHVIYEEMRRRAAEGLSILLASSDVEDLLASCDRIIALRDGKIAGEFEGQKMTKTAIAYAMEGAHDEQS
jgi:ribose transport system ATP-binding protein